MEEREGKAEGYHRKIIIRRNGERRERQIMFKKRKLKSRSEKEGEHKMTEEVN
jgi:hypothetical protein